MSSSAAASRVKRERTAAEAAAALYASLRPRLSSRTSLPPPRPALSTSLRRRSRPSPMLELPIDGASPIRRSARAGHPNTGVPYEWASRTSLALRARRSSERVAARAPGPSLCGEDDRAYEQGVPSTPCPRRRRSTRRVANVQEGGLRPRGRRPRKSLATLARALPAPTPALPAGWRNAGGASYPKEESGPVARARTWRGSDTGWRAQSRAMRWLARGEGALPALRHSVASRVDPASIAATAPYVAALKPPQGPLGGRGGSAAAVATPMWRGAVEDAERRGGDVHLLDQVRAQQGRREQVRGRRGERAPRKAIAPSRTIFDYAHEPVP